MHALAKYVLPAHAELNMIFQFELMDIDAAGLTREAPLVPRAWALTELKGVVNRWQTFLREDGFWNRCVHFVLLRVRLFVALRLMVEFCRSVYIENHDQARSVSRFGSDGPRWRARAAKMLALLQVAQTGTLYVYQGEEMAMANVPRSWGIVEYKDVATQNYYKRCVFWLD